MKRTRPPQYRHELKYFINQGEYTLLSGRRILILDEPTSGLDGKNMRLIAERLKGEARSGRTILVITPDRELIESCCDNVVEIAACPNIVSHDITLLQQLDEVVRMVRTTFE